MTRYVQKQGIKLDMLTILYVNSVNCVPILLVIALASSEFQRLLEYGGWGDPYLYVSLGLLMAVGGAWVVARSGATGGDGTAGAGPCVGADASVVSRAVAVAVAVACALCMCSGGVRSGVLGHLLYG